MNEKLSVVCCLYNEDFVIKKKISEILSQLKSNTFFHEVIFIDNHSTDGTREFLKKLEFEKNEKFKFIFNQKNLGKGGSIKEAIKIASGDVAVIFDMDEYFFEDIKNGYNYFKEKNCDFLIGSRSLKKKKFIYKKNYHGVRILTQFINILYKTNLTDSASATKFFSLKKKPNLFKTLTNGFSFEFELLINFAKNNLKIQEYEIDYNPRTFEQGKKIRAVKDGFKILFVILLRRFI